MARQGTDDRCHEEVSRPDGRSIAAECGRPLSGGRPILGGRPLLGGRAICYCPTLANPLPCATSCSRSGDTLSHFPPVSALYFLSFSSAVFNPTSFSAQNIGPPR